MAYLKNRAKNVKEIHEIYNKNIPDYIKELLEVQEIQRLSGVSQSCGVERTNFRTIPYKYSRLDHSLGVALILDNFVNDRNQVIAGLLHDIASPAFSHTIDFLKGDYITQETTEYGTYDAIIGSDMLFEYFLKNEISINDMCDYSKYPLADNERPKLCADRLEYILHTAYLLKIYTYEDIKKMYDDLMIVPNEDNMPEFCFDTEELGKKFCLLSIELR